MSFTIKKVISNHKFLGCAAFAVVVLWNAPLRAADATIYQASPSGSTIRIDGDSTAHKWFMDGVLIGGRMELPAATEIDTAKAAIPGVGADGVLAAKVTALVSVRSMHSHADVMANVMDNLYQEALKATNNPNISYKLSEMKLKPGHAAGKPFEFDTKGELAIACVTNKATRFVAPLLAMTVD